MSVREDNDEILNYLLSTIRNGHIHPKYDIPVHHCYDELVFLFVGDFMLKSSPTSWNKETYIQFIFKAEEG